MTKILSAADALPLTIQSGLTDPVSAKLAARKRLARSLSLPELNRAIDWLHAEHHQWLSARTTSKSGNKHWSKSGDRLSWSNDRGTSTQVEELSRLKREDRARRQMKRKVAARVPACRMENLGDASFRRGSPAPLSLHGRGEAMANGRVGSIEIVEAMGRDKASWGFSGAAGLSPQVVDGAIQPAPSRDLGDSTPFAMNLIHSPGEPELESGIVSLYLARKIRLVEASAFLNLTLPLVRYRVAGIRMDSSGQIRAPNRIIAKVSRVEVASKFMAPPPDRFLRELVATGEITADQAGWAGRIPMAEDITAEADSGGHTDNQPAIVLLPTMLALRNHLQARYGYDRPLRIGAAGGISTPWAAAAAFAMGAAYIVTGSVNQSCVEAGTSDIVRRMLAQAQQADIAMAPAADMFEMGVKVQVLEARHAIRHASRQKLYELYRGHPGLDQIPASDRESLEKTIFRAPIRGDDLGSDAGILPEARTRRESRRSRARSQAEDGACLPLVPGNVIPMGQQAASRRGR